MHFIYVEIICNNNAFAREGIYTFIGVKFDLRNIAKIIANLFRRMIANYANHVPNFILFYIYLIYYHYYIYSKFYFIIINFILIDLLHTY